MDPLGPHHDRAQEPQLHSHVAVLNRVVTESDGVIRAHRRGGPRRRAGGRLRAGARAHPEPGGAEPADPSSGVDHPIRQVGRAAAGADRRPVRIPTNSAERSADQRVSCPPQADRWGHPDQHNQRTRDEVLTAAVVAVQAQHVTWDVGCCRPRSTTNSPAPTSRARCPR